MYMHELKEKLCEELKEIARKGELGAGDLEIVHKLTDTIKNLYSRAGDWEADMRGTYGRGSSYRGRKRDSMGRYSRDGRMYSRTDAKEHMMDQIEDMMSGANEREKEILRRAMEQLEKA